MKYFLIFVCLSFSIKTSAQERFKYKKQIIDPLTFEDVFFSLDNEVQYSLPIKLKNTESPIEIVTDPNKYDEWIANYLFDVDRIDYRYLGKISDDYHCLIIRFAGGSISNAKIIVGKILNDSIKVEGWKKIDLIPESGIIANYEYVHLGKYKLLISDIIGKKLSPIRKELVDYNFPFKLKRNRNIPFVNIVFDVFKIEFVDGQPMLTFYSFEDFNYFNKPKGRIESLAKNDFIKFHFKNGTTLSLKYTTKPVVVKKETKKLILSNSIYLSKFDVQMLAKNKINAIETEKREYLFKGNNKFERSSLHSFDYLQIPSDMKYACRKIWKLIK